jgi:hypothetical protein
VREYSILRNRVCGCPACGYVWLSVTVACRYPICEDARLVLETVNVFKRHVKEIHDITLRALGRDGWFALIQKTYNLEFQLPYLPVRSEAPSIRAVAAALPMHVISHGSSSTLSVFAVEMIPLRIETSTDVSGLAHRVFDFFSASVQEASREKNFGRSHAPLDVCQDKG